MQRLQHLKQIAVVLALAFMLIAGWSNVATAASSLGGTNWDVEVSNFEFTPANLTISVGDSVTWTNVEGTHNVESTSGPESFGNSVAQDPWTYSYTFDVEGTYTYECVVHPSMQGTIEVLPPTAVTVGSLGTSSAAPLPWAMLLVGGFALALLGWARRRA